MNFVLLFVLAVSIWKMCPRERKTEDYMGIKQTSAINGIFVLLVFLRHFGQYIEYGKYDQIFHALDNELGQVIVTTFLLYSGYGMMYSMINKKNYVNTIPKRFVRILLQFDCAIVLFVVANAILGKKYGFADTLLAFTGWESIGNSNWYIFAVLCLYIITFIAGKLCKEKYLMLILSVCLGCFVNIILMKIGGKPRYCYDTIFCFPVGMLYALYFDKLNSLLRKRKVYPAVATMLMFFICVFAHLAQKKLQVPFVNLVFVEIKNITFALTIVGVTMMFAIGNPILSWLGKYVFEIYILQRIPMMLLKNVVENKYVYFVVCFVITIVLSIVFKKAERLFSSLVLNKSV
ncbi:acyltransferase family protein [Butyrivibrio sp. AE3009]|uniref:acyltransferase family protein n=1 Tax=Butyrivibrio sp. AE3009 TaxID=1280666 RepID=UPI0003B563F7|nr:acyltransferase [Butyrivibrio sp. AE3009]